MTRRKTRTLPSSDESPKTTRRSSRKRNDVEDSSVGEENDKANCVSKAASKSALELAPTASPRSKRAGRHVSPPVDGNSASTRRSLRRPAPCGSVEEDELTVPPVKKLRGRAAAAAAAASSAASSNNNSPSATVAIASSTTSVIESDESENSVKTDAKCEKHVKNSTPENDDSNDANATSVPRQQQKSERTRKRRLADPNENDDSFVTNDSGSNCANNDDETDAACKTKPSGKLAKEEASKRRKVSSAVSQQSNAEKRTEKDNGHEKRDLNHGDGAAKAHGQTNGVEEDPVDDWSGWSESASDGKKESLFNRVWKMAPNCDTEKESIQFSILSYNILAESLLKNSHYFKNISPSHWNQQHRHRLLMKELADIDADIFCLQEVEKKYFQTSLAKELSRLGYKAIFACSETPGREEGIALCFRDSRFRLVTEKTFPLSRIVDKLIDELNIPSENKTAITDYVNEPQMLQCALLECCRSGKRICVSNIHVSYAKHMKPDLRCAQIARAMWEAESIVASYRRDRQEQNVPLVLCGDLNSTPGSPVYQLCRDGYLNDKMLNRLQRVQNIMFPSSKTPVSLVNVLWKAFQHPVGNIRSSYFEIYNREPPLTQNLKGNKGCLDYIWFTDSDLKVKAALPPRCGAIKKLEDAMPNNEFPSDHLSLAVQFTFP